MKTTITTVLLVAASSLAAAQSACPDGTTPQCCIKNYTNSNTGVSDCTNPSKEAASPLDLAIACDEQNKDANCCTTSTLGDQYPVCRSAFD